MIRKLTKKEKVAYFKLGRKFVKKFTCKEWRFIFFIFISEDINSLLEWSVILVAS